MFLTFSGRITDPKLTQPENAALSSTSSVAALLILISVSAPQFLKALMPTYSTPAPKVRETSLLSSNALSAIVLTESGTTKFSIALPLNASAPIATTEDGKVTVTSAVVFLNVASGIFVYAPSASNSTSLTSEPSKIPLPSVNPARITTLSSPVRFLNAPSAISTAFPFIVPGR